MNTAMTMATNDPTNSNTKVKVKNMPLYDNPSVNERLHTKQEVSALQQKISQARRSFIDYMQPIEGAVEKVVDTYKIGKAHSIESIEYIQSDPAVLARVGVISVAALGGVVAAYRGGPLRKLFYGTFAGVSVAAVCYPREAVEWGTKAADYTTASARSFYKSIFPTPGDQKVVSETVSKIESLGILAGVVDDNKSDENLEDHGQSKPEDSDLYSTRSS